MDPVLVGLLGLLIFFPLVQVPLVLWLGRYLELDEERAPPVVGYADHQPPEAAGPVRSERQPKAPTGSGRGEHPDRVRCRCCGEVNHQTFTYCRNCLTALG